jgi:hypothetical protein
VTADEADRRVQEAQAVFGIGGVDAARFQVEVVLAAHPAHQAARILLGMCLSGRAPPRSAAEHAPGPEDADGGELTPFVSWYGEKLVVRFDWPLGTDRVGIACAEGEGLDQAAVAATAIPVFEAPFRDAGGLYVITRPPLGSAFWVCVFQGDPPRAIGWTRVARMPPTVGWRVHEQRTFWGKLLWRSLILRWPLSQPLAGTRVCWSASLLPLRPSVSGTVAILDRVEFDGHVAQVPLAGALGKGRLRLFPGVEDQARGVRFLADARGDRVRP